MGFHSLHAYAKLAGDLLVTIALIPPAAVFDGSVPQAAVAGFPSRALPKRTIDQNGHTFRVSPSPVAGLTMWSWWLRRGGYMA